MFCFKIFRELLFLSTPNRPLVSNRHLKMLYRPLGVYIDHFGDHWPTANIVLQNEQTLTRLRPTHVLVNVDVAMETKQNVRRHIEIMLRHFAIVNFF